MKLVVRFRILSPRLIDARQWFWFITEQPRYKGTRWTGTAYLNRAFVFETFASAKHSLRSSIARQCREQGWVASIHTVTRAPRIVQTIAGTTVSDSILVLGAEVWPNAENLIEGLAVLA